LLGRERATELALRVLRRLLVVGAKEVVEKVETRTC